MNDIPHRQYQIFHFHSGFVSDSVLLRRYLHIGNNKNTDGNSFDLWSLRGPFLPEFPCFLKRATLTGTPEETEIETMWRSPNPSYYKTLELVEEILVTRFRVWKANLPQLDLDDLLLQKS